ncbi:hypothetical protein [Flavivirga spongiicola]|uniref:DUF4468 domain-containing protein n=1 Tax=Flavivirga spongiicola TaxID=421621 RepID=A0ABU7XQM3_9FLAO|nr:hypothetical protein [Flavivirga sp. MEBiC05379]MDO5978080.1 hypothetical protein [Flavivirga sp. MEBiC05379]
MKSLFLLLCSTFIFGFTTSKSDHFKIKNGQVIWQKVYDTDLTKKQLIEVMRTSSYFEDIIIVNEKKLTAKINQLSPDYKTYGSSYLSAPDMVSLNHVKAFTVIEFKEKQYRVTLKSIKLIEKRRDSLGKQVVDIEDEILNKDNTAFKRFFFKKSSKILDFTLQKITDFNKISEDDTW